jgi:hypothetical protein
MTLSRTLWCGFVKSRACFFVYLLKSLFAFLPIKDRSASETGYVTSTAIALVLSLPQGIQCLPSNSATFFVITLM